MTNTLVFWTRWLPEYRRLLICGIMIAGLMLAYFWVATWNSPAPVFRPLRYQQLEPQDILIRTADVGLIKLDVQARNYLIFEHIMGGPLQPNIPASYIFVPILLIAIVLLVTVATTLSRFWFFSGVGLFMLLLASLRLETLLLFGVSSHLLFLVLALSFGGIAYYFVFVKPTTSFNVRFLVFMSLSAVAVALVWIGSRAENPVLLLAANGVIAGTILTVVFIFMVAHEIISSFIDIVSRSERPTRSLQHFLVISAIYLVNIGLLYADKKGFIRFGFFPWAPYALVSISGILGFWGFRQREPLYESILKANPFGVYLYLAISSISFATMAFLQATANDPALQLVKDSIIYAHLGYGIIFLAYVVANFLPMLGENLAVYKVLYKPTTMPYFTFRLAGLIATFAFFAYSNWKVSVNQLYAGYYNGLGDIYLANDSLGYAENLYKRSVYFATRNYHAHYALAQISRAQTNIRKAKQEYDDLSFGRPLDLGYLNWNQLLSADNEDTKAARVLEAGLRDFPKNGYLLNALALNKLKTNHPDSALALAKSAAQFPEARTEAQANLVGICAKFGMPHRADSLLKLVDFSAPAVRNNLLALASAQGLDLKASVDIGTDTVLNVYKAASANNAMIDQRRDADTAFLSRIVKVARRPSNYYFRDFLIPAAALAYYEHGMKSEAFKLIRGQAFQGRSGHDYDMIGLWAIEQGAPAYAIRFLDEAILLDLKVAGYHRAIALTESGDYASALQEWEQLQSSADAEVARLAARMKYLLTCTESEARSLPDIEKYEFSRLRFAPEDETRWEEFIASISDNEWRARAIIDRSKKLDEADQAALALTAFPLVRKVKLSNHKLYEEILQLDLRFLAQRKQWSAIGPDQVKGLPFDGDYVNDKLYFEALLDAQAGRNDEALRKFTFLATADPFYEDAVISSLAFLESQGQEKIKLYSMLVSDMDSNPDSPKLLKYHILKSWQLGFESAVQTSTEKLRAAISPVFFKEFLQQHPDIYQVTVH